MFARARGTVARPGATRRRELHCAVMKRLLVGAILATVLANIGYPQSAKPFLGRWDLTLTSPRGGSWPQWMEIVEKEGKLEGRIQPRGGAVRPIAAAKVDAGHLIVTVSAATQRAAEVTWD